jgi:hypothetical protein
MDENQIAAAIVSQATQEKNPHAQALSKLGASKGGLARAKKLSARKRKQIALKAARKRWNPSPK